MKRVYVVVPAFDGSPRYYARHQTATDRNGSFSQPYFVENKAEARPVSEDAARIFVRTLRNEFRAKPWLEDTSTGEHIEVADDAVDSGEDKRTPKIVSFNDDGIWHIVRSCLRPTGKQWYVKVQLPDRQQQTVYANSIDELVAKILEVKWTSYLLDRYEMPAPAPGVAPQAQPQPSFRLRPGSYR